jgi:hypothetical protein
VSRAYSANVCSHFIALPITIGSVRYPGIKTPGDPNHQAASCTAARGTHVQPLQSLNRLCRLQQDVARGPRVKVRVETAGRSAFVLMLPPVQFVQEPSHV